MIRRERRDGGEGVERGLRREQRGDRDREKRDRVNNLKRRIRNQHLPLLVVQLPQGTTFLLSSRLDSAVKRCSCEVLFFSGAAW